MSERSNRNWAGLQAPKVQRQASPPMQSEYESYTTEDDRGGDDHLQSTIQFVNQELAAAGFPASLDILIGAGGGKDEAAQIVSCIFTLLQQRQKDLSYREDLNERLRRAAADNDDLASTVTKLKSRLEHSEREVDLLNNKLETAQKSLRDTTEKHKLAREELKTTQLNLNQSKAQYQMPGTDSHNMADGSLSIKHELRKRERDFDRLKERLQRLMTEKQPDKKAATIKWVNALPKSSIATGREKKKKSQTQNHEDEMYGVVLANYEEREKELLSENANLRKTLFDMYSELKAQLKDCDGALDEQQIAWNERQNQMEEAHFQLPFDLVQHSAEHKIRELIHQTREVWEDLRSRVGKEGAGAEELERLRAQCEDYQETLEKQNELLEMHLAHPHSASEADTIGMSTELDEQRALIAEQRELIENQRARLEEERRKFTEAAMKLGLEREALQMEKNAFEEEKRAMATENLLEKLPQTPQYDAVIGKIVRQSDILTHTSRRDRWLRDKLKTKQDTSPLRHRSSGDYSYPLMPSPLDRNSIKRHPPSTPGTPFRFTSYSTLNPAREADFMTTDEIVLESDTLATTPGNYEGHSKKDEASEAGSVTPVTPASSYPKRWQPEGITARAFGTPITPATTSTPLSKSRSNSSIKSALKKTPSTPNLGRTVRIAVEGRDDGIRPGQDASKENIEPGEIEAQKPTQRIFATSTPKTLMVSEAPAI
ncbi:hypothetical protein HK104_006583 [Borealophlyctis nickersoniae]|nr:hypothetical protein HK104_006583 [Borealophlyctis nickersoniae]